MISEIRLIEVKEGILADNDKLAEEIRERLQQKGVLLLNLMASPGAGKTSLVLQTLRGLKGQYRIAVIEADIDSMVDAETVAKEGVKAIQLRTGGHCHVDAVMVELALAELDLDALDLVIIENVGNLVCPAEFDTGARRCAMILSVPEGDDKPLKYPLMFSLTDALLINKTDYLALSDFNIQRAKDRVTKLNPDVAFFEASCKTGDGIGEWLNWLRHEIEMVKRAPAEGLAAI